MKLFRFKTSLTMEDAIKINESLSPADQEFASQVDIKSYDVIEDGRFCMYAFSDDVNITKAMHLFRKNGVPFKLKDISENALMGEINVNDVEFKGQLNHWLMENLSVDDVLDKINKHGIESLTDIDRFVLNKY